jgi:hypothetical protein
MEATLLGNPPENRFSLSGTCPHCARATVFMMVTSVNAEPILNPHNQVIGFRLLAGMQCQGCKRYILGIVKRDAQQQSRCEHVEYYPLGKPNDDVALEIPENIAADFKEALRCRWVEAFKASVSMCGRALEASCINLGADPDIRIRDQIDWLASQGKITTPLKDMAHKIRLGRNRGAHPPSDGLEDITTDDVDLLLEFTRDFFQHVYVMPKKLESLDLKRKPRTPTP